jgi:hypothetical protein
MKTLRRIAMEFWSGLGDAAAADSWAEDQLRNNLDPHPDVHELLFKKSRKEITVLLLRIAHDYEGFLPVSQEGEKEAIEILNGACDKFLREEITPSQFCRVVSTFDAGFLDFTKLDERTFEYPAWLGNLWNACDWCDESWTNANSPHLLAEAKRVLANNTGAKNA